MQKKFYFQKKWKFCFSNRRWTNQTSQRRSGTENIHLDAGMSNSRRKKTSLENQKGLHLHCVWMPVKQEMISGPCQEVNRFCLVLGQVSLNLLHCVTNLLKDMCGRRGGTDKTASDIQARSFMARTLDEIRKKCPTEGEAKMVQKNRNSIMPDYYEEFISLTLKDKEFKETIKTLARNWKLQWRSSPLRHMQPRTRKELVSANLRPPTCNQDNQTGRPGGPTNSGQRCSFHLRPATTTIHHRQPPFDGGEHWEVLLKQSSSLPAIVIIIILLGPKGGAPKGGGPEGWGHRRVGAPKGGWGPEVFFLSFFSLLFSLGPPSPPPTQNFAFFLSPTTFFILSSSSQGSSRRIW